MRGSGIWYGLARLPWAHGAGGMRAWASSIGFERRRSCLSSTVSRAISDVVKVLTAGRTVPAARPRWRVSPAPSAGGMPARCTPFGVAQNWEWTGNWGRRRSRGAASPLHQEPWRERRPMADTARPRGEANVIGPNRVKFMLTQPKGLHPLASGKSLPGGVGHDQGTGRNGGCSSGVNAADGARTWRSSFGRRAQLFSPLISFV